eukprot:m.131770 g.131770  ORF g.131770 m.131770 type:complete len:210 (+) comp9819_c0_seq4:135-764(+)
MLSTAVSAILTNTLMSHSDQCCQSFSASLRCRNLFPTHRRRRAPSGKGPSTNKKSRSSSPEPGASDAAPGASAPRSSGASRKPKGSGSSGGGGGNSSNTDMMFVLSDRLARILQDDAHQIRRKNLVPLPRDPTVSRILSDFSEFATLERSAECVPCAVCSIAVLLVRAQTLTKRTLLVCIHQQARGARSLRGAATDLLHSATVAPIVRL